MNLSKGWMSWWLGISKQSQIYVDPYNSRYVLLFHGYYFSLLNLASLTCGMQVGKNFSVKRRRFLWENHWRVWACSKQPELYIREFLSYQTVWDPQKLGKVKEIFLLCAAPRSGKKSSSLQAYILSWIMIQEIEICNGSLTLFRVEGVSQKFMKSNRGRAVTMCK